METCKCTNAGILSCNAMSINDMYTSGAIEMVDATEQMQCFIAT